MPNAHLEMLMSREQAMVDVVNLFDDYSSDLGASVHEELREGVLDILCKHFPA